MRIFTEPRLSKRVRIGHTIAGTAAVACIIYGFVPSSSNYPKVKAGILSFWIVAVPFWFAIEAFFLYDPTRDASLDRFKYAQEVATKVWLAVSVVLAGLYFGKDGLHLH